MGKRRVSRIGAALLLACFGAVAVPSCVIRIGPGDGSDGSDPAVIDSGQSDPGEHYDPGTEITPEESAAAIEDLASADPMEAEIANYKATYAAYALAGIVNTTYGDSEPVDEAQIQEIVNAYFPQVWEEANLWVSSLDPSAIVPQAAIKPADECYSDAKYGCNYQEKCAFDDGTTAVCTVTGCGINGCKKVPCPDLWPFDLSKLIVKSWCTFTCMKISTIVGMKLVLNVALFKRYEKCVKLETPIP